ncbi:MAG: HD domain-containing protein [Bacteroidota bacterium]|nr:HD domain-containing protein [Bacteroidota bacterium]
MLFEKLKKQILSRLESEFQPCLYYHNLSHTLDVSDATLRLAKLEGVDSHYTILLATAALLHDVGMLENYAEHEIASVRVAQRMLPELEYTQEDMDEICNLILATRLPQEATTLGEMIICDADLDYLGRDDFFMIAHRLRCEWNCQGRNYTLKEWYTMQASFLMKHHYFTRSAIMLREQTKQIHLQQILELLKMTA